VKNVTILIVFCLLSIASHAQEAQLNIGVSSIDMELPLNIPLAGYGSKKRRVPGFFDFRNRYPGAHLFKTPESIHSPIRSKVMLLNKANDYLVFISLDTIGIEHRFIRKLAKRLKKYGIKKEQLIVGATHTHGGPGTLSKRLPLQLVAVDFYNPKNFELVLDRVVEEAFYTMAPAELYHHEAIIEGVQKNKWRKKDEEHFDKKATFLLAKDIANNTWMGGVIHFSIHGGTMPVELMQYSSDINGAIEHQLEEYFGSMQPHMKKPAFVFLNGAEGDVGGVGGRGIEELNFQATKFLESAKLSFETSEPRKMEPDFSTRTKKIFVGIPGAPLKDCNGSLFDGLPHEVRLSIFPFLPAHSVISQVKIGDLLLMTWPGEPSTQLGYDLQAMAKEQGYDKSLVVGLTNDYMTYFTTKSEYQESAYDSCSSFYGWKGGERVIRAHKKMLRK
jgi:uncharacterized protein YihD (DUF1040 family)